MNFLQLATRLSDEAGASGEITTTVGNVGEARRLVNWVNQAWVDIQSVNRDWQWLRTSTSFTTTAGQAIYTTGTDIALTDFGMWHADTFRIYPTATGVSAETFLPVIDYEDWRNTYQLGSGRLTQSQPTAVAIAPDKSLCLGPYPAAGYTVTADYFKAPSELSGDSDTPELPTQFHMAIVWRALMYYGGYESAIEAYQRGDEEFKRSMNRMEMDRLPAMQVGDTLA